MFARAAATASLFVLLAVAPAGCWHQPIVGAGLVTQALTEGDPAFWILPEDATDGHVPDARDLWTVVPASGASEVRFAVHYSATTHESMRWVGPGRGFAELVDAQGGLVLRVAENGPGATAKIPAGTYEWRFKRLSPGRLVGMDLAADGVALVRHFESREAR